MLRPEKTPMIKKHTPVYRTPTLREVINMMVPTADSVIGPICGVRAVYQVIG